MDGSIRRTLLLFFMLDLLIRRTETSYSGGALHRGVEVSLEQGDGWQTQHF
jgi:hypothetical protein